MHKYKYYISLIFVLIWYIQITLFADNLAFRWILRPKDRIKFHNDDYSQNHRLFTYGSLCVAYTAF